jgi:hypothetical protein
VGLSYAFMSSAARWGRLLSISVALSTLSLTACGDGADVRLKRIRSDTLPRPDLDASGVGTGGAGDGALVIPPPSCTGLACQVEACDGSPKTSVSGVVYDPAGKVPLYNVVVYVPGDKLAEFPPKVQCQTCEGFFGSAKPVAVTITGTDGHFKLEGVPAGNQIPLVIQVGRWRREIFVPHVAACTDTPIDKSSTRLPMNHREGHIPKIAIATGGSDALECLVRKIGIDLDEFTNEKGPGRVNLFYGRQWVPTTGDVMEHVSDQPHSMENGTPLTSADDLWNNESLLDSYDMMLLSCEGTNANHIPRTALQYENVRRYADLGGRIYGSHWHHDWIDPEARASDSDAGRDAGPDPYPEVVNFATSAHGFDDPITAFIVKDFPKGGAFAEWLWNVGASPQGRGQIEIKGAEHSVDSIVENDSGMPISYAWIDGFDTDATHKSTFNTHMVQYFSFNTPVGKPECGRMVFSDVHVSAGAGTASGKLAFPEGCNLSPDGGSPDLSPQEKALEFMIFDLSSCVQPDGAVVLPPPFIR